MILEILVDEHSPIVDHVLQKTQITAATTRPLHCPDSRYLKVGQSVLDHELSGSRILAPTSSISIGTHTGSIASLLDYSRCKIEVGGRKLPWIEGLAR